VAARENFTNLARDRGIVAQYTVGSDICTYILGGEVAHGRREATLVWAQPKHRREFRGDNSSDNTLQSWSSW